ncbi:MAG: GTPase [Solirubrobacterales bacterium]
MRRILIMGAGGRDFHDFNVAYRNDPEVEVVAFTATQIPGIDDRVYPPSLAGPRYPHGIPIRPESELSGLIDTEGVDEVVFAYSDVTHEQVMHLASAALAAGADFTLLGPGSTMVESERPVVAVCATRTGAGKSQTSRAVGRALLDAGLRVGLIRHPMPYGDLEAMRAQRFETIEDIDASDPTIEEREEYERPVEEGMVVYAGVDYGEIVALASGEVDAIIWDGGNNDFPFIRPDLMIVVVDPLRPEDALRYHPGETNLRMADVVIANKLDSATPEQLELALAGVAAVNPGAPVLEAESPVTLDEGPSLEGRPVVVIEDGPSITHGEMAFGAGTVAAERAGAKPVDPRPHAVGSVRETLERFGHIGLAVPAMGYSAEQLRDLEATINAIECDAVIAGTPISLGRIVESRHPIRQARYELRQVSGPPLAELLAPIVAAARA